VHWVSLGDSYASADGVASTGPCARSAAAFAPLAENALHDALPIASFVHVACSGARIDAIAGQLAEAKRALPSGKRFDLATIVVGGNDVGFAKVLFDCVGVSDLTPGCAVTADDLRARAHSLAPKLEHAFRAVAQSLASNGVLVVVSYPQLFEPPTTWATPTNQLCDGLRSADVITLRAAVDAFDAELAHAASAVGARFLDVRPTFVGHGRCGNDVPWLHGLSVGLIARRTPFAGTFHPNDAGQAEEARLLEDLLRRAYR
jgi:lysophospholipase L1-like esterase